MSGREEAIEKMRADGASDVAVDTFAHYYDRLAAGEQGTLPEAEIEPAEDVPDAERLPDPGDAAAELLERRDVGHRLDLVLAQHAGVALAQPLVVVAERVDGDRLRAVGAHLLEGGVQAVHGAGS